MTDTAESLDPLRLPLIGERLIEASAGTGKTFTIAALYLRLLLGLGGEAAQPRAISVEELLVVTFTEAATRRAARSYPQQHPRTAHRLPARRIRQSALQRVVGGDRR